jgi:hypothetical protein
MIALYAPVSMVHLVLLKLVDWHAFPKKVTGLVFTALSIIAITDS